MSPHILEMCWHASLSALQDEADAITHGWLTRTDCSLHDLADDSHGAGCPPGPPGVRRVGALRTADRSGEMGRDPWVAPWVAQ